MATSIVYMDGFDASNVSPEKEERVRKAAQLMADDYESEVELNGITGGVVQFTVTATPSWEDNFATEDDDGFYAVLGKDGVLRLMDEHIVWAREHRTLDEVKKMILSEFPDAHIYEHPSGEIIAELGICEHADGVVRPIK